MKGFLKAVTVGSLIAMATTALPTRSYASDRDWTAVGKVLTGVAAVGLLSAIIDDVHHQRAVVHAGYYAPPPPPSCEPPRHWIPGHYEARPERVCVPGYWDTVVDPPQYGWVRRGCRPEYVIIRPGCTRRVWVPDRYEVRETRVWVPAHADVGRYAYNR